jgi:hypothetical protein
MRRVSGPNPFTRGPSTGSASLSCHDIGWFFFKGLNNIL